MNVQQKDQMEYQIGMATEQQNAAAVSRMTAEPDGTAEINQLIAAGRFVVVERGPNYCRFTDAIIGSVQFPVSDHATREQAEAWLNGQAEDWFDLDHDYAILPRPTPPSRTSRPSGTTDESKLPF